tara:strand:- start:27640 stop:28659 length:1020 start_codon:yes stop_codon:yes gene_type:complete
MRVLITGSTGFVGSHCLESLSKIPQIDVIPACRDKNRLPPEFQATARVGDLLDPAYQDSLLDGIDVVIHAAAWTSLWGNKKRSDRYFLRPSLELVNKSKRQGIKRFIFISTLASSAPDCSHDPMSHGIDRPYWPHLSNVIKIEEALRSNSDDNFTAINLRLGLFVGSRYALGILPTLLPRLKTHLVPWVAKGKTSLALIDGKDIGQCASLAVTTQGLKGYESFNVVGPDVPTVREVIEYLHEKHNFPLPHFNVSFPVAFIFAGFMELINPLVPWEPLVTRSIIHLLRETNANNDRAETILGYTPKHHWKKSIDNQVNEMSIRQSKPMRLAVPLHRGKGK